MKRIFTVTICLLLIFTLVGTSVAYASVESNAYITSFSAAVSVADDGTVTVNFGTNGTDKMDKIGASAISVYENGTCVATYLASNPVNAVTMMRTDAYDCYGYITHPGTKGNTYRAYVTHYAEKDGGHGTEDLWTASTT